MCKWRQHYFFPKSGREVDWTSTRQDKIIGKNYFCIAISCLQFTELQTPTESESDNPEELPQNLVAVFNGKHKYFPSTGQTNNMCSLNKGCSIWRRNISPSNSRWYQQKAYLSSIAVGNLLIPWNIDYALVVSVSSGLNTWEMFIKCVEWMLSGAPALWTFSRTIEKHPC